MSASLSKAGLEWWDAHVEKASVPTKRLFELLLAEHPQCDRVNLALAIKYIIDPERDAQVSRQEFHIFLQRFGPWPNAVPKALDGLFTKSNELHPWFHGDITKMLAQKQLKTHGDFLIRFTSKDKDQNRFSLVYHSRNTKRLRWVHVCNSEDGYYSVGLGNKNPPKFPTLLAFVIGYTARDKANKKVGKWVRGVPSALAKRVHAAKVQKDFMSMFEAAYNASEAKDTGGASSGYSLVLGGSGKAGGSNYSAVTGSSNYGTVADNGSNYSAVTGSSNYSAVAGNSKSSNYGPVTGGDEDNNNPSAYGVVGGNDNNKSNYGVLTDSNDVGYVVEDPYDLAPK